MQRRGASSVPKQAKNCCMQRVHCAEACQCQVQIASAPRWCVTNDHMYTVLRLLLEDMGTAQYETTQTRRGKM